MVSIPSSTSKKFNSASDQMFSDTLLQTSILSDCPENNNLDVEWREKAEKELGESSEISRTALKQFRHLLRINRENVPFGWRDDAFLLRFLRAKKFDVDKAYRMTLKYFRMKQQSPELFRVSPPSEVRHILEMQMQYMIPLRDPCGRQVFIFRVEKCDPYRCSVENVFRTNVLSLESVVRNPETQIAGLVVLLDMTGVSLGHSRFLSPQLARNTVEVVQDAFPLRFKAFHILHEPFYFDAILAVLKPFLREKIRKRIFLHGSDLASLYRFIPQEILPAEYGGLQPSFDNSIWRQNILDSEEYFANLENYQIPEENSVTKIEVCSQEDQESGEYVDDETEDSEFEDATYFLDDPAIEKL
ncbi:clavesin-2-like isoform X2 [Phlebotomus papatasi]|uniref:clavesin-2-like isoform X2 n=1 Tax=Phlebotomus papatasi TaxID=29031 RepID=UPI002483CAB7|nr:clavesin-2-like isoform X2 [Phlebotomus papatasi]XP_055709445.1 clavesin-2-like isoform X2 [Phlebotomus papatasi]